MTARAPLVRFAFPSGGRSAFGLLAALVAVLLLAPGVRAQSASVRGFVRDLDGQPLPGVNVTLTRFPTPDPDRLLGSATDANGFYAVTGFPAGRYVLRATFVGYATFADTLDIESGVQQIDVALTEGELGLDEVAVVGERAGGAADVTAGFQRVRPEDVMMVPSPDVAGDLANYLTTLPGIVTSGDRGGQLFVRGGEPTQNLVLLDGMPVFLPFHVLGFYSAFPADLLLAADVYAGGYGARFGGQLSSVLDVTTRPGNLRRFGAQANVAPFIVGGTVEGPIVPGQASILLSGRRSLVEEVGSTLAGRDLPYAFSDAFAKVYFTPIPASQLSLTGMYTTDRGAVGDPESERPDEVSWTNAVGGFRYQFLPPSIPTRAEIRVNYTRTESTLGPSGGAARDSAGTMRTSSISRYNVEFDLSYYFIGSETKVGGFLRRTSLFNELGGLFQNVLTTDDDVLEAGVFLEPEFRFGPLTVGAGARFTLSPSLGQQFFEPRFRAIFQTRRHRLSASGGLYNQPIVGISDRRDATSIFTVWTSAPDNRTPRALHLIGGYSLHLMDGVDVGAEAFYKKMEDISVGEWTASPRLSTRLQPAEGEAAGADLRLEVRRGPLATTLTYGYARVTYAATQTRYRLWYGEETLLFHPSHDRRHQLNAFGTYELAGFELSARIQFGSGLPYSEAVGFDVYLPPSGMPDVVSDPGSTRVIYGRPFNRRLPAYHRLDVSVSRDFDLGPATLTAQVGAVNVYNRRNLFAYDTFTLRRVDQLPFVPTFGLQISFD